MEDETLQETASEQEQPVTEAVEGAPSAEPKQTTEPAASSEQPAFTSRMFAGKYKDADELERAYLESQREASRMAGELSALKRGTDETKASAEPKWKQLESERQKWAKHLRNPNLSEQERWEADEQVRLHDREIAKEQARYEYELQSTRQSAVQSLEQESSKVLTAYQSELSNMASPLYQASAQRYEQLIRAGHPDDMNTKALAVAYAAAITGTTVSKAIQQDRSAMLKTLNKSVKQAVVTGAGGPATMKPQGVTAKDIESMSPAEFAKYERTLMGV